ncbi:hypothetical protein JIQ88_05380 [Pseudomonas sp. PCH44]|uniref:hypothetical protein n=1 Tax=Pseudomonas sp. PCH44 TaxID=2800904 RepID=UPI001BAED308|nr:hypothetical protein [Pseudomonas sp. PCH44]MBS3184495.1 hypothetical protein [Pseudomonas sp. PCH44]
MPTENRSSNTEMVSAKVCGYTPGQSQVEFRLDQGRLPAWLELGESVTIQPAEHHQGEPVEYRWEQLGGNGWCYGEKLPAIIIGAWQELYAHGDRGEVERLRAEIKRLLHTSVKEEVFDIVCKERDTMGAQLAERDALLRESSVFFQAIAKKLNGFHDDNPGKWCGYLDDALGAAVWQQDKIDTALSASAEPQVES